MKKEEKNRGIKISKGERAYYWTVNIVLGLFFIIILAPLLNVVASSFSSAGAVNGGRVFLWPVEFTLDGYKAVFHYKGMWRAYGNTFLYTFVGTAINLGMTMICAFPLAKKNVPGKGIIMALFTFTMLFSGGMIPTYLLIKNLHIMNTMWALILPGAISVYNMIIARTFIQGIPSDLDEAAKIDGCSDFRYFFSMVLPLSKTVMAVLALYYAVGHWNSYMDALLYLSDSSKYPLQILLREVLMRNAMALQEGMDDATYQALKNMSDLLKYSMIIVSTVPVLVIYPFAKKYFLKGVMIGALKG